MDPVKAKEIEKQLVGVKINGWTIEAYHDCGKSAAVFRASKGDELAALKIFDDELIQKYGDKSQLIRIERELTLKGKSHPNLVKIFDGGFDDITQNHFIIMEWLDGPNLSNALQDIPYSNVPILIEQLASAALYLESLDLSHRDIKPENIIILGNFSHLVLLDFGVIRPVGDASATDGEGVLAFVGTLQYSSPEFLLRQEEDTQLGWRALTFYQIGAVLHDLIMRRPLFEDYRYPYARLVNAVQTFTPEIKSDSVTQDLANLCAKCLLKDPQKRVALVTWGSFMRTATAPKKEDTRKRVLDRVAVHRARSEESDYEGPDYQTEQENLLHECTLFIKASIGAVRASSSAVPRGTARNVNGHNNTRTIKADFDGDAELLIPEEFACFFRVSVEDVASRIVTIECGATFGSDKATGDNIQWENIFQGPYDGDSIYTKLEEYIYKIIDGVQTPY